MLRLAPDAVIRLQQHPTRSSTVVWAIILGTLVRREFAGRLIDIEDVAVSAAQLAQLTDESVVSSPEIQLPPVADHRWRSTIPPSAGWVGREEIPTSAVLSAVHAAGMSLADATDAQANNAGEAMLSQTVITVDGSPSIEIPLRSLLALVRMGFAADGADSIRVAVAGPWTVLATRHGGVYRRRSALDVLTLLNG